MTTVKSGTSGALLTVDPTSLAARATLYEPDGTAVYPTYTGTYCARIDTGGAAATADAVFWAMKNTGTRTGYVRAISYMTGFIGTAAASRSVFRFEMFSGATPTGGTAMGAAKRYAAAATSTMGDIRGVATLTVTGAAALDQPFASIAVMSQLTTQSAEAIDLDAGGEDGRLQIAAGEGIWLRAVSTPVVGAYVCGTIMWEER